MINFGAPQKTDRWVKGLIIINILISIANLFV